MADNNTNNSKIEKINDSDIISESIEIINKNFQKLAEQDEIDTYKWTNNMKAIKARMDNLENNNGLTIGILNKSIDDLREEVKNTPSLTNIQDEVKKAIRASEEDMAAIVHDLAGTEISTRLGDFAKTTDILSLDSKISGVSDKVANQSTAFESYKSEASSAFAQINHTAANSRYFTNKNGYLVDISGNQTPYKTIEKYFKDGLSDIEKQDIDPDNKGLDDKDVMNAFLSKCDTYFGTTATEMATIQQTVTSNAASIELIATIQDDVEGVKTDVGNVKTSMNNVTTDINSVRSEVDDVTTAVNSVKTDVNNVTSTVNSMAPTVNELSELKKNNPSASTITAAIFLEANKEGSNITLNANHLNLSGDDVKINTENFKVNVNNDGAVSVTGAITATALTIAGNTGDTLATFIGDTITSNSSVKGSLEGIIEAVGTRKGWADTTDPYPDGWLKQALSSTSISGGLILTGNLFAGDSDSNITAGVMGATTASNDLRFFAGSSESNAYDAPFRVYEDGSLYASNATITGSITVTELIISGSAAENSFNNLVKAVGANQGWYKEDTGDSDSDYEYDDSWLDSAFNKTIIEGGLALTGNMFVADSNDQVTAGLMGGTESSLRFFVGSSSFSSRKDAPFKVYKDGSFVASSASIAGNITATSLTITGDASNYFNTLVRGIGEVEGWYRGEDSDSDYVYDDSWLTSALSSTSISGGLILTGNVFAANSSGIVTAGMMGGTTESNNLRFFAGSDDSTASSAPFRVYEDGSFYANDANLIGDIYAKSLNTIGNTTRITSDGVLYATGAHIEGDITANRFLSNISTMTSTINGDSWTFERQSAMNSEEFRVSSTRKENGIEQEPSHIYITILPEYLIDDHNSELYIDSLQAGEDGTLIGVPVLCFEYNGKPYYLTPGSWKSLNTSTANDTNMYWSPVGTIYTSFQYTGNSSGNTSRRVAKNAPSSLNSIPFYVFKPSNSSYVVSYGTRNIYRFYYDLGTISGTDKTTTEGWLDYYGLTPSNNASVYSIETSAANYGTSAGSRRQITLAMCQTFGGMKANSNNVFTVSSSTTENITEWQTLSYIANQFSLNPSIVNYICSDEVFGNSGNSGWGPTIDCTNSSGQDYGGEFVNALDVYNEISSGSRKCKAARKMEYSWQESYTDGIKTNSTTSAVYAKCTYGIVVDLSGQTATNYGDGGEIYDCTTAEILISFNVYFDFSANPINTSSVGTTVNSILESNYDPLTSYEIKTHTRFEGVAFGEQKNGYGYGDEPIATIGGADIYTWTQEDIFNGIGGSDGEVH